MTESAANGHPQIIRYTRSSFSSKEKYFPFEDHTLNTDIVPLLTLPPFPNATPSTHGKSRKYTEILKNDR